MGSETFCTVEQGSCVARHSKIASMVSPEIGVKWDNIRTANCYSLSVDAM